MIKTFKNNRTRKVYEQKFVKNLPQEVQAKGFDKLKMLNAAQDFRALKAVPGNDFKELKGDEQGTYQIRINTQFRIKFTWDGGNAYNVHITDDHR